MKTCARKGCIELAFPGGYFDGLCGRECQNMVEEYQRGRDNERAAVVADIIRGIHELAEMPPSDAREAQDRNLVMGIFMEWKARVEKGEHGVKR